MLDLIIFEKARNLFCIWFYLKQVTTTMTQPKNDSGYHSRAQNVWRRNSPFFRLSVLSIRAENEIFNQKLHDFYHKSVLNERS